MLKLVDKKLLTIIFIVIIFGLLMILSASYNKQGFFLFYKQLFFACIAVTTSFFILKTKIKINNINKYPITLYLLSLLLLSLVFFPTIGHNVNGSYRWINLIVFKVQPSEIVKLIFIIIIAKIFTNPEVRTINGTYQAVMALSPIAALILAETDIGTAIIITLITFSMLFIAGTKLKEYFITLLILILIAITTIYTIDNRLNRAAAFYYGEGAMDEQRQYALIGIARGDLFGTGIGGGLQKITKLSEAHTDMIFAVIGEETGIIGMLTVFLFLLYILIKGFKISEIALKKGKIFNSYLAFGISSWFSLQVFFNLFVNLSLIPPTGVTLPLISYGGTSIIMTIISLAILLKIDIENKQKIFDE